MRPTTWLELADQVSEPPPGAAPGDDHLGPYAGYARPSVPEVDLDVASVAGPDEGMVIGVEPTQPPASSSPACRRLPATSPPSARRSSTTSSSTSSTMPRHEATGRCSTTSAPASCWG